MSIAFIGMTHLGLNSAVAAAKRGFDILCFDRDPALITALKAGKPPVQEPQLREWMKECASRLNYTSDPESLGACEVIYVAPDVATDDQGNSDLTTLNELLTLALYHAKKDTAIVVLSQVPPGYCRGRDAKGKTLIYQVETLIFGQAIDRAYNPERTIIGLADPSKPLPKAYANFLQGHGNPPLFPMRYESAELAKIAINCCLVSAVSTANTLAEICERIGADWSDIVPTLKADRRIGQYSYLAPGLGISGGNLERDLNTVIALASLHGTDDGVVQAWLANSSYRKHWPLRMLATHVFRSVPNSMIGILGLTYKENTHSVKNSPSVALIRSLTQYALQAYDPAIAPQPDWHPNRAGKSSALDAARGTDVLLLLTAWPEFRTLEPKEIAAVMRGNIVMDPFALLPREKMLKAGLQHITLGSAEDAAAAC
jgi:UDPglucose 6-dehydrogenase